MLPKQRDRETDKERKGEKTSRNAVNPQATEQFSGERKEEFLCAAGEQNREGGSRRKRETGRWKKRARTRGWPREFERNVKGFDCCVEKGDTLGENEVRMAQNNRKWPLRDDTRMDTVTCVKKNKRKNTERHDVRADE